MKIVINTCFGGFGLSPLAIKRLAELNGKECYFFSGYPNDQYKPITIEEATKDGLFFSAFSVPNPKEYLGVYEIGNTKSTKEYDKRYEEISLYEHDIKRDDPKLIQVVEELGKKANGRCADLTIVEIPDGVQWEIGEYDGNETIHEVHRSWR